MCNTDSNQTKHRIYAFSLAVSKLVLVMASINNVLVKDQSSKGDPIFTQKIKLY